MSALATFTLGQVLSVTTGRLLCDIGDCYKILNHITGDSIYTHVIPRAMRFAAPILLEAHPEFAISEEQDADLTRRIEEAQAIDGNIMGAIGAWLSLLGLPMLVEIKSHSDSWLSFDPVKEAQQMIGKDKVIVRKAPSSTQEARREA